VMSPADDGGAGTLRTGIGSVCPGGTITFDPVIFAGPSMHTIELTDANGKLTISSNMTITGPGSTVLTVKRVAGALNNFRVFDVGANTVTISGMTISNGNVVGAGALGNGGGILNAGTLTLSDVIVSGNQATGDVGAAADPGGLGGDGKGGGFFNSATLTIN